MRNLKSLVVAGMIGVGSLGIFENVKGQENLDSCKRNPRNHIYEFLISLNEIDEGKLILNDINFQDKRIVYVEDVPYTTCSGKKTFANVMILKDKGDYLTLIDIYNKTNLSEKITKFNDIIEYVIEKYKMSEKVKITLKKGEKYSLDSATDILDYESARYNNVRNEILLNK